MFFALLNGLNIPRTLSSRCFTNWQNKTLTWLKSANGSSSCTNIAANCLPFSGFPRMTLRRSDTWSGSNPTFFAYRTIFWNWPVSAKHWITYSGKSLLCCLTCESTLYKRKATNITKGIPRAFCTFHINGLLNAQDFSLTILTYRALKKEWRFTNKRKSRTKKIREWFRKGGNKET